MNEILIDDIFSTGASVNECARILKENGAKRVYVFTLGRTIIPEKEEKKEKWISMTML